MEKEESVLNFMGFSFFYIHQSRCLFFTTLLYNTLYLPERFRLQPLVDGQYFTSELFLCCRILDSTFYSATVYHAIKGRFVLCACRWIRSCQNGHVNKAIEQNISVRLITGLPLLEFDSVGLFPLKE